MRRYNNIHELLEAAHNTVYIAYITYYVTWYYR